MKILITSDTHGFYDAISDYILLHDDINLLIHAGDGVCDLKYISYETGINYYVVKGNNDYDSNNPYELLLNIKGRKIYLTHGHKLNVNMSYDGILKRAQELNADIAIFGHIHKYVEIIRDNVLLLNPGSVSLARDNDPGFIILSIDDNSKITTERISLNK